MLIGSERDRRAAYIALDRHDLLLKSTFSDCLRRTTVSLNRKGVLICSRDAVAFGNIFCRLAHVDFEDGIGQRLDHRVEHRHRAHLGPPARGRHDMRRVAHPLRPAAQHNMRFAKRSEENTPELQSLMRTSYAVFCLKKKKITQDITDT